MQLGNGGNTMKVKFKVKLEVTAIYDYEPGVDKIEDLKLSTEFGENLQAIICDEIIVAGGIGCVDILDDSREFIEEQEDHQC